MHIFLAWLPLLLKNLLKWGLKRLVWVLVGGGAAWIGWETGILQVVIKALMLALFDLLLYVLDGTLGFLAWVLTEQNWQVPDAYTVMGNLPAFSLQVLDALGVWNQVGLLISVGLFKFLARIFTLRLVFR